MWEQSLLQPLHPHQIHDITVELRMMFATMHHMGDWTLFNRVSALLHQARITMFRQCHEFLQRCAALVDACTIQRSNHQQHLPFLMNIAGSACCCAFDDLAVIKAPERLQPGRSVTNLAASDKKSEIICTNCSQRPVGPDWKKCGFQDWCSECDKSLWATNPDNCSYDSIALAINECDDVLFYLELSMKQFYIQELRPKLVSFMGDFDDDSSDLESTDNTLSEQPAAKRSRTIEIV